jgi:hypothetical protein
VERHATSESATTASEIPGRRRRFIHRSYVGASLDGKVEPVAARKRLVLQSPAMVAVARFEDVAAR